MPPFDPYHAWLGIAPYEQPADYYRLLGLTRFESDPAKIAVAADQRMHWVRGFQAGPQGMYAQSILNELAAAKVCLLSPASKLSYDAALGQQQPRLGGQIPISPGYAPSYYPQQPAWRAGHQAPPPVPPPKPEQSAAPRITTEKPKAAEQTPPAEPETPSPWWLPIALLVAAALVLLASVAGWGIWQSLQPSEVENEQIASPADGTDMPADMPEAESPPEAQVMLQEGSGEVNLPASTATLEGAVEVQELVSEEVLGNWTTPQDAAQWDFRLVKPGFFHIEVMYSTSEKGAGSELEVTVGPQRRLCELRTSGGLDNYVTDSYTIAIPSSGRHTLRINPGKHPPGEWLVLRRLRLIPVARNATAP